MKKNMGSVDRAIRAAIAIILLVLVATGVIGGTAAIIFTVLAGVFLLTGLFGFCPAYFPLNLNTLHNKTN